MKKRGQNQYMSWILIFGMVIALSFVLYNWSISQARERTEEIETRTDPLVCEQLGISVESACQDFKSIKINITNTKNVEIDSLLIRTAGLYQEEDDYLETNIISEKIRPGETKKLVILKKQTISKITIVPIAKRKNKDVYCEEQAIEKEQGELTQC